MVLPLIMAGASVIGAISSNNASKRAANAQRDAASQANDTQRYIYDNNVRMTEPQRQIGVNALNQMAGELGIPQYGGQQGGGNRLNSLFSEYDNLAGVAPQAPSGEFQSGFTASPGYEYRRDEGLNALGAMAAARGMRLGGAAMKDAQRLGDGMASQEYGTYMNRLASMAGMGQTAGSQQIQAGQNYANAFGQNAQNAGAARASAYVGGANALNGLINNGFGIAGAAQSGMFGANPWSTGNLGFGSGVSGQMSQMSMQQPLGAGGLY